MANLFAQNHVTDDYSYDAATDPVWGITPSSTTVVNDRQFSGVSITVNTYASDDDHVYTALAGTTNGSHEALSIEAKVAWRFMSQFSRNADGTVSSNGSTPAFDRSSD